MTQQVEGIREVEEIIRDHKRKKRIHHWWGVWRTTVVYMLATTAVMSLMVGIIYIMAWQSGYPYQIFVGAFGVLLAALAITEVGVRKSEQPAQEFSGHVHPKHIEYVEAIVKDA